MGIPSYFSYIIKNYSNIIRNLSYFHGISLFKFHHLYMDCNSIVYDAVHSLEKQEPPIAEKDFENALLQLVSKNIDKYISLINPINTIYIAFDGVAPFAKMEQQRTRRYKSAFMSKMTSSKCGWNTAAITPGTIFMEKLSKHIEYTFLHTEQKYNVKHVLVSCSNQAGEGEHKLFAHIRNSGGNLQNENVAVYGLDSDLIMLSIFHIKYCKNIFVFRETPEFLKAMIPDNARGKENEPHFLDIAHLSNSILAEMRCKCNDTHRIYDYVFLCFFLGNDFLPHFPAMNIRTHGIQGLLDIYRMYIGNYSDRHFVSTQTGKIQWKYVKLFINEVAKREHEYLTNEYFVRDKFDKRQYPDTTPEEKNEIFQNIPVIYRGDEKYICPEEPYWETRYYKTLLHYPREDKYVKQICNNYLEGLQWVLTYYTSDCTNWHWKYNYHYPPLFIDLCKYIPHFDTEFIDRTQRSYPFSMEAQLSYVLSNENLALLSPKICEFLKNNYAEYYPLTYEFQWAFCRYFWEAHPILPEIPLKLLLQWDTQYKMMKK